MTFVRRAITATFLLGQGNFGESGFNTVTVSGLRIRANVTKAKLPAGGPLRAKIYGLTPSLLNQLSNLTRLSNGRIAMRQNEILLSAGDYGTTLSQIFRGQIVSSHIDLNDVPNSPLSVHAVPGYLEAYKSTTPLSFPGTADAVLIMQNLAVSNGYTFENGGVPPIMLSTPYFPGTPMAQMSACAQHAGFSWAIDNGVVAIWPKGESRDGLVPVISPGTGMIGYPTQYGIGPGVKIRTLFNPNLTVGRQCRLQSSLQFANGNYAMFEVEHDLESETPNGKWETSAKLTSLDAISQ